MKSIFKALGLVVLGLITCVLVLQFWYFAHVLWWVRNDPDSTAFMREQLAVLQQKDPRARLDHRWVPYAQIAPALKRAVIAAEEAACAHYKKIIKAAEVEDYVTQDLCIRLLADEEGHLVQFRGFLKEYAG